MAMVERSERLEQTLRVKVEHPRGGSHSVYLTDGCYRGTMTDPEYLRVLIEALAHELAAALERHRIEESPKP